MVLTYWNLRGIAQVIRNLLEYLQLPYQENTISFSQEEIQDIIKTFENVPLPSLKDGDETILEVIPICKYLCRIAGRNDLLGKSLKD